jgi:hypothetical protein
MPARQPANCVVDAREAEAIEMGELDQELDDLGAEFMTLMITLTTSQCFESAPYLNWWCEMQP